MDNYLRNLIELTRQFEKEGFATPSSVKREIRSRMRGGSDPIAKPITEEYRVLCPREDGETVYWYSIFPEMLSLTDEEIAAEVRGYERHNNTPYDCSGQLCTCYISWKRCKAGVSIVHCLVLDV